MRSIFLACASLYWLACSSIVSALAASSRSSASGVMGFLPPVRVARFSRNAGSASFFRSDGEIGGCFILFAGRARAARVLRRAKETQVLPCEPRAAPPWSHVLPLLDQELERLPQKYRLALVLCDLQGRTRKEVARELGCPEGTVASRLARARGILARRLARFGVAVGSGALGSLLSGYTDAGCLPPAWMTGLLRASCQGSVRTAASAGLVAPRAVTLAEGVMGNMLLKTLVNAGAVLLMTGLAVTSMGLVLATSFASGTGENKQTVTHARLRADANADSAIEEKPTNLARSGPQTTPSPPHPF